MNSATLVLGDATCLSLCHPTHGPSGQQLSLVTKLSRHLLEDSRWISSCARAGVFPTLKENPNTLLLPWEKQKTWGALSSTPHPQQCSTHLDFVTDLPPRMYFEHYFFFFFKQTKPSFTGPLITSPRQLSPGRGYRGGAGGVRPFGPGSALPSAALEMSLLTSAGREGSAGEKKTSAAPPASLGAKNTTPRHTVWWGVGHGSQRDQGQEGFAWCSRSAGAGGKARALGETERKQEKRQEELLAGGGRKGERQSLEIPTNRGTSPFPPAIATSPAAQSACSVLPAHTRGSQRCFLKTKHSLDSF